MPVVVVDVMVVVLVVDVPVLVDVLVVYDIVDVLVTVCIVLLLVVVVEVVDVITLDTYDGKIFKVTVSATKRYAPCWQMHSICGPASGSTFKRSLITSSCGEPHLKDPSADRSSLTQPPPLMIVVYFSPSVVVPS